MYIKNSVETYTHTAQELNLANSVYYDQNETAYQYINQNQNSLLVTHQLTYIHHGQRMRGIFPRSHQ